MKEWIAQKLCPLTDQRLALVLVGWGNIEIPELHSPPQPPLLWAFCWGKNTIE